MAKRITPQAYQALRDALCSIYWYKRRLENFLRTALRESPELLVGLNFDERKREVADQLVDRLMDDEDRYQDHTLQLMLEVSSITTFPDLHESDDPDRRFDDARAAVAELGRLTADYSEAIIERERRAAEREALRAQDEARRRFADDVAELRAEFLGLAQASSPQDRGRAFEPFLGRLFDLFDMEPRLAYSLEREQIDGSVTFDTDDYIVEARWRNQRTSHGDADIFASKVRRKGKNALGLFVSIGGFSQDAFDEYSHSTPFLAVDGTDLMCVLDGRIGLDDLLRRKKRHANETGHCFIAAAHVL